MSHDCNTFYSMVSLAKMKKGGQVGWAGEGRRRGQKGEQKG